MDIVLLSTTDLKGGREKLRERLLQSLDAPLRALGGHRLALHMLLQNCGAQELASFQAGAPAFVRAAAMPGRVSLSAARNTLLRRLLADGSVAANDLVAFPDDDCWYPPDLLCALIAQFTRDSELDFWFCRYGSCPEELAGAPASAPGSGARFAEIVRNASSNTIFLRGRIVTTVGEFDERLGIGTALGGSEDLDYALRARRLARRTLYRNAALVGHRDKSPEVRARYFASSLIVLARHARDGALKELVRKIAVGVYLMLRAELAPRELARALRLALAELGALPSRTARMRVKIAAQHRSDEIAARQRSTLHVPETVLAEEREQDAATGEEPDGGSR